MKREEAEIDKVIDEIFDAAYTEGNPLYKQLPVHATTFPNSIKKPTK